MALVRELLKENRFRTKTSVTNGKEELVVGDLSLSINGMGKIGQLANKC